MLIRSVLFSPATRLDRLPRALTSGADLVVVDLEDGVGEGDKDAARMAVSKLAGNDFDGNAGRIGLRINTIGGAQGIRDMAALLDCAHWPGVLVVPKVNAAAEVTQIASLVAGRDTRLLITLESAIGLSSATAILSAAPQNALVGYGSADHMAETGGTIGPESLAWPRGQIVNAAAATGLSVLDGVWLDYKDAAGLEDEARLVKSMGFSGKIAIHPDQIPVINRVFSPTDEELAVARAMIEASQAAGGGAFSFNGKMVDAPVLARAQRLMEYTDRSTT
ncbi:MAG: HpcH/HpaI aldolase/citrate lyase family protein [Rhizobiaceae bacterium]